MRLTRRRLLQAGLASAGGALLPSAGLAAPADRERILVVFELSGGNDGLNTLIPYADDAYYRHRPKVGVPLGNIQKLDDHFGLPKGLSGLYRLYREGRVAAIHGCGYASPSFSHFTSMAYWHTAAPNSGAEYGWLGRLADVMDPAGTPDFVVNIDTAQSLAVRSRLHTPIVFDDPERFARKGTRGERALAEFVSDDPGGGDARRFLLDVARSARNAAVRVREAWSRYESPVDYGLLPLDLDKIVALIDAGLPTRLYYTSFRNNAFDTHVYQPNLHERLLTYASDAIAGFQADLERIGRADDVVVLVFSEFGRRVPENTNLGTDHGAANVAFVVGKPVRGGHYGTLPSLTELDEGDNLVYTTDFRRVYASLIEGWLGVPGRSVLGGDFETFPLFHA